MEKVLPRVIADGPVATAVREILQPEVELLPWDTFERPDECASVIGVYTYGHPNLDGTLMDRVPEVKVISNYGVGVDHIRVDHARARGIPVGNTPDVLNGATADMGFALLMAAGRRLAEGDRYARGDAHLVHDPGLMLGREIHGATLGILGMGRIGTQVARRGLAFDMRVIYHNRSRNHAAEEAIRAEYVTFMELLQQSDYLVLSLPLSDDTRNIIGVNELDQMKPTATLINIARGAVVDTDALTDALENQRIYAAGLDVTDPEPLPRGHRLLDLENVVLTPHLGSATVQTRHKMAEISCANLLAGLRGEPLLHQV